MKVTELYKLLGEMIKDKRVDELSNVYIRELDETYIPLETINIDVDKDLILEEY